MYRVSLRGDRHTTRTHTGKPGLDFLLSKPPRGNRALSWPMIPDWSCLHLAPFPESIQHASNTRIFVNEKQRQHFFGINRFPVRRPASSARSLFLFPGRSHAFPVRESSPGLLLLSRVGLEVLGMIRYSCQRGIRSPMQRWTLA